jgi:hypothetical protein
LVSDLIHCWMYNATNRLAFSSAPVSWRESFPRFGFVVLP